MNIILLCLILLLLFNSTINRQSHAFSYNFGIIIHVTVKIERFHHGRGLMLLLAVATGFYMLKVPSWESLPPKY